MTAFSFSIFSVIFFSSNQVCIFVGWKQPIESGTYQLSVSRPGSGGRPLTYSVNGGYSDATPPARERLEVEQGNRCGQA